MPHTDPLHELIRSLSPSEKRYFKLQNKSEGSTKSYMQLFDALESLEQYDELKLRKLLEGQKLLNQLHVAKNYLHKQILRALRSFHAGSEANASPFLTFAEHLGDMSILHAKGLFDQSKKALRKAEAVAEQYDDDLFRLIIAAYRHDRVSELVDISNASRERYKHRVHLLERLRINFSLKHSLEQLFDALAVRGVANDLTDPLDAINFEELSFAGKIDYCSYRCYEAAASSEHAQAAHWARQALDLFDHHPHQRDRSTEIYLSLLSNYFTCLLNDDYVSVPELLNELRFDEALASFDQVNARTPVQKTRVWATRRLAEFEWALATSNDGRLKQLLPVFEKEFAQKGRALSKLERGWFSFTISKAHYWAGDLNTSILWINRLLDDPEYKNFEDYYGQAMVYSLVVHQQLGNVQYVRSAASSTRRYLESRALLTEPLEAALKLIHSLAQENSKVEVSAIDNLRQVTSSLRFFEFDRWIAERIQTKEAATL